jgi:hypothetical protein
LSIKWILCLQIMTTPLFVETRADNINEILFNEILLLTHPDYNHIQHNGRDGPGTLIDITMIEGGKR